MSEKSDFAVGEPIESQSAEAEASPSAEDKVGPGRPPCNTRWKKGGPSPNPRGRPRKDQSMLPDVRKAFEQALNKKVPVTRGDKTVLMNRMEIGFEQLLNQVAKGDRHARKEVMDYAGKLGIDFLAQYKQTLEEALTPNYQAILDGALARRSGAANGAPAERVFAPPELVDDDVNGDEASDTEAAVVPTPKPAAKPYIPEPDPVPGKHYPKPFKQMTPRQRMIYYQDWWDQYGELWERCGRP